MRRRDEGERRTALQLVFSYSSLASSRGRRQLKRFARLIVGRNSCRSGQHCNALNSSVFLRLLSLPVRFRCAQLTPLRRLLKWCRIPFSSSFAHLHQWDASAARMNSRALPTASSAKKNRYIKYLPSASVNGRRPSGGAGQALPRTPLCHQES